MEPDHRCVEMSSEDDECVRLGTDAGYIRKSKVVCLDNEVATIYCRCYEGFTVVIDPSDATTAVTFSIHCLDNYLQPH